MEISQLRLEIRVYIKTLERVERTPFRDGQIRANF